MTELEQALELGVTKITIELHKDGFRWSLFRRVRCTFTMVAAGDQVQPMLESTGIILETQLGLVPQCIRDALRATCSALRPSLN
jgi:hypothetical protein